MAKHRWVALGAAPMTTEQAQEWASLTGSGVAKTGLEVMFSSIVCVVCLEEWEETSADCPGPDPDGRNEHIWQAFFTAAATDEDAAAWGDPDRDDYRAGYPRSVAVLCVLCGESPDDASVECNERAFWSNESTLDVEPGDFHGGHSGRL